MYALVGWDSPVSEIPDVEIRRALIVECESLICGYKVLASTGELAIELRRQHIEWHEEGCPRL